MNARLLKFFLCSSLMHLAALWLLWQAGSVEYGAARETHGARAPASGLFATLVASEQKPKHAPPQLPETEAHIAVRETTTETALDPAQRKPESATFQGYFPAGRLTRLPFPLADVDLDVTEIDEVAIEGAIELTILVEADGTVADVSASISQNNAQAFADRVAARFQRARFAPGEINGKAVKSQLRITVVSEPRSPAAGRQTNSEDARLKH